MSRSVSRSVCCPICDETCIRSFKCHDCEFTSCVACVKKYILTQTSDTYKCMSPSCQAPWDLRFILTIGKSFFNTEFRAHRKECLRGREKSLLSDPATLQAIKIKKAINHYDTRVIEICAEEKKIQEDIKQLQVKLEERRNTKDMYKRLSRTLRCQHAPASGASGGVDNDMDDDADLMIASPFNRPIHCAIPECKGFLNAKSNVCTVCTKATCRECLQPIDGSVAAAHVCDKQILETNKLVRDESKPCPKCGEAISKTEGCDQMFCVICKTAFSWNTGVIEKGKIHNPHYYELVHQGAIKPTEEENDATVISPAFYYGLMRSQHDNLLLKLYGFARDRYLRTSIASLQQCFHHLSEVIIAELKHDLHKFNFANLRAEYALGECSEDVWMENTLKLSNKKDSIEKLLQLYQRLHVLMDELFKEIRGETNLLLANPHEISMETVLVNINNLLDWFNKRSREINTALMAEKSGKHIVTLELRDGPEPYYFQVYKEKRQPANKKRCLDSE